MAELVHGKIREPADDILSRQLTSAASRTVHR